MADRNPVIEAKRKLYLALLEIKPDDLTDPDLAMMDTLMRDKEIQAILNRRRS